MWKSPPRKPSREIDTIDVPIRRRRQSLTLNFSRSSLKDVEQLFADDDDINIINNTFNQTLDPQLSPCSTTATATTPRRLSIFHRVHLANKFARAFAANRNPNSPKSPPDSINAEPGDKLAVPVQFSTKLNPNSPKSLPDSTYAAAPEILTKSDGVISIPVQFPPKLNPNSVKCSPDSINAAAEEKLAKADRVISIPAKLNPNSPKSAPESVNTSPEEKLTKSDGVISIPGAETRVVLYTTSLRIVRPTFEACRTVQSILRGFRVSIDERDLSMDSRFLNELQNIMAETGDVDIDQSKLDLPRVFIGGKYIGGAEEVKQLHETGELKKFVERLPAVAAGVCDVCGDFRFIVCDECRGSHKCYSEKAGFRSCTLCNENGLIRCPLCLGR